MTTWRVDQRYAMPHGHKKSQSSCIAKKSVVSIDVATEQTDKNECGARDTNSRDKLIRNSHLMGGQAYKGHEWS